MENRSAVNRFKRFRVNTFLQNRVLAWLAATFLGFLAGYIAFGNANEVRRLNSLLSQAQADRDALSQENAALLERRAALREVDHTPAPASASPTNSSPESITEADIKTALEMNKRSRNGEYILQFERPTDRKIMESAVKEFAQSKNGTGSEQLILNRGFICIGLVKSFTIKEVIDVTGRAHTEVLGNPGQRHRCFTPQPCG